MGPNHAPGAGKALQLLSSCDPWPEGKGSSTCLWGLLLVFPSISILGAGLQPKDAKTHRPSIYKWPQAFPQPLLVPQPLDMRYLGELTHIWAHLGTAPRAFNQLAPAQLLPQLQHSRRGRCQHPALSQERQNKCHLCARERADFNNSKDKTETGEKKPEKEPAQGLQQHTKQHQTS